MFSTLAGGSCHPRSAPHSLLMGLELAFF